MNLDYPRLSGRPLPLSSSLISREIVGRCHGMLVSFSFRKRHMMCSFYKVGKSIFNVVMAVFSFSLYQQNSIESRRRSRKEKCNATPSPAKTCTQHIYWLASTSLFPSSCFPITSYSRNLFLCAVTGKSKSRLRSAA